MIYFSGLKFDSAAMPHIINIFLAVIVTAPVVVS